MMTRNVERPKSAGTAPLLEIPRSSVVAQITALKTATQHQLKQRWRELFGSDPPPYNRRFLESRLAYRLQALVCGELEPEIERRLEALGEQLDGGNIVVRRTRIDNRPIAGTRLVRSYQGVDYVVTVLNDGYEYEGRPYRSLSAIARAITGTRWNGWTFFGLGRRGQM